MTPEERAANLKFYCRKDCPNMVSWIAAQIREAVEEAFEQRGYAFQDAIQKCLEEKRLAKAEAFEEAAKIALKWAEERYSSDSAITAEEIAEAIRARNKK